MKFNSNVLPNMFCAGAGMKGVEHLEWGEGRLSTQVLGVSFPKDILCGRFATTTTTRKQTPMMLLHLPNELETTLSGPSLSLLLMDLLVHALHHKGTLMRSYLRLPMDLLVDS